MQVSFKKKNPITIQVKANSTAENMTHGYKRYTRLTQTRQEEKCTKKIKVKDELVGKIPPCSTFWGEIKGN